MKRTTTVTPPCKGCNPHFFIKTDRCKYCNKAFVPKSHSNQEQINVLNTKY